LKKIHPERFNFVQLFFILNDLFQLPFFVRGKRTLDLFAFDFNASITCSLGSSHSLTKINFMLLNINFPPRPQLFSLMFLQSPELHCCCDAFPSLLLFQGPHEIVFFK
jgi:hypothetical protein